MLFKDFFKKMLSNCIFSIFCDGPMLIIFKFVYRPLRNSFVFNEPGMNCLIKFIYLWSNLDFVNCAFFLNFKVLINNMVDTKAQD
jgi:hypothetical protein